MLGAMYWKTLQLRYLHEGWGAGGLRSAKCGRAKKLFGRNYNIKHGRRVRGGVRSARYYSIQQHRLGHGSGRGFEPLAMVARGRLRAIQVTSVIN